MCKRDRRALKALLVIVLLFFMLWFSTPMTAMRVRNSVVTVHVWQNNRPVWMGSGVIVDNGIVLTARHIVDGADKIRITTDEGVEIISTDFVEADDTDLGLIIFDSNDILPQSGISVFRPFVGQSVFGIGSRYGLNNSFFQGFVGTILREVPFFGSKLMTQLDIAGNPGDSGCPIYNRWGNVVGILVGGKSYADGVTFIVPAKICRLFVNQYKADRAFREAK